jgi:hypothetical protein
MKHVLAILVGVAGFLGCVAGAQGKALSLSPLTVEATADAGRDYTSTYKLWLTMEPGEAPSPEHIKIHVGDWDETPDGKMLFEKAGTCPNSCASWLTINPDEVDLEPGAPLEVRYTVSVPAGTPNGTYWAIVYNQTQALPAPGNKVMGISGALGMVVYITVGPRDCRGKLTAFHADANGIALGVEDLGSTHLRVGGKIEIQDAQGQVVREFEIKDGGVVLPTGERTRNFQVAYPKDLSLPPGRYTVTGFIDYHGDKILGARTLLVLTGKGLVGQPEIQRPAGPGLPGTAGASAEHESANRAGG